MLSVEIGAVRLSRRGGEKDPDARAVVEVEVGGRWVEVLSEPLSSNFCSGVNAGLIAHRAGVVEKTSERLERGNTMTTLREELLKKIDDHLGDWDKEDSWNRQAERFANSIIETVDEFAPRRFIPDNALCLFLDGDQWCCCRGSFVNLQESLSGFGSSRESAIAELERAEAKRFEGSIAATQH